MANWNVDFSTKAEKQYLKLKRSGSRPSVNDIIDLLVLDLQKNGPQLPDWPILALWKQIISIATSTEANRLQQFPLNKFSQ